MRRPPGLWILLSAGVLWLSLQDVYGIRATALIFGKSSTTTTTEVPADDSSPSDEEIATTDPSTEVSNVTKPPLTGIPQIDYIWDPNLPKELNGYNLSDYPFYERVPDEEMEFKCDGLHDGFYASVPHKCQVYHHCLFGTRYDFLCANYTAFDQKTFICQFVSEVDCVNSKKFWHRNDALYQAASTTTAKPLAIYTTAPPSAPPAAGPLVPSAPGRRRRPLRRRRPQYEYYDYEEYDDDYYEERPRVERRRKRPRPRPRPYYDDEYDEEYEEDKLERRGGGRRDEDRPRSEDRPRRPYRRRNKDRKKPSYDDDEDRVDDRFEDEDLKYNRREQAERKKPKRQRPSDDRSEESDRPKPEKKSPRRPVIDNYEDELPQNDDRRSSYERPPRRKQEEDRKYSSKDEGVTIIKPATGTIYDRPRVAPRIKLPVPKNEADKYAYKSIVSQPPPPSAEEEEYYDDYEEEPLPKSSKRKESTSASTESSSRRPYKSSTSLEREESSSSNKNRDESTKESRKQHTSVSRPKTQSSRKPEESNESTERPRRTYTKRPKYSSRESSTRVSSFLNRKRPSNEDDYVVEDYEDDIRTNKEQRPKSDGKDKQTTTASTTTSTTTTTTTTEAPLRPDSVIRIVKRPFLPSRGGNPYVSRGLQPVGTKAAPKTTTEEYIIEEDVNKSDEVQVQDDTKETKNYSSKNRGNLGEEKSEQEEVFKPSPIIVKVPISRTKYTPTGGGQEEFTPIQRPRPNYKTPSDNYSGPRTTQKPKVPERNPLDINENEYDVTLNDALNPTLPNLPVRGFPTGFSAANDYTYSNFQRPRFVVDSAISPSTADYTYTKPVVRQRFELVPQTYQNPREQQYSPQNFRPRQQTHAIYSSY